MFHTFQGLSTPRPSSEQVQDVSRPPSNGVAKRITTPHACAECKRRKIRCDGRQPCGQCLGCRSPKACYYDKHRQRVVPSRKILDTLSQSLDESRTILKRLYPNNEVQSLLPLDRQDLIALIDAPHSIASPYLRSPTGSHTPPQSQEFPSPITSPSDDCQSLAHLEQIPGHDSEWDEERRTRDSLPAEADDFNALSLSVDRQSSYLGATSIKAAFLVMLKVAPGLRAFLTPAHTTSQKQMATNTGYPTPRSSCDFLQRPSRSSLTPITWSSDGQTLIDAYFNRVQILMPMLDEPTFRADYLSGRRKDSPWLALLNMVFAMGSIVANKSDDLSHIKHYNRAKEHVGIDSFGSSHIETLQAMGLMGGQYLHYINRPNIANTLMGAALRMACAMGFHRESLHEEITGNAFAVEQRRRTWWSLFCLDTWASATLGRPSMGPWGPTVTVRSPECSSEMNIIGQNIGIIPLIENIKFCKIATQIQDVLAQAPLLRADECASLDSQLVAWHENLPWVLHSTEPCPESIYTARCIMKWRYQNLRIVLHRPVLLHLANCGNQGQQPTQEELSTLAKVRAIAKETIEDIAREWTPNQMLGWNGVWFIYQASMIPLVSMFWESWDTQLVRECQNQLEIVVDALEGMSDWSLAARRIQEVVNRMYEASKKPLTCQLSPGLGPFMGNGIRHETGMHMMNSMSETDVPIPTHLHPMNSQEQMHVDKMGEEGMFMADDQDPADLNGMLWGDTSDSFDRMPMFEDFGMNYDGNFLMQQ
ncbi:fungal-specific transcription factor domain-containing protein [Calycina marina]|uniref:Fungal-specific transcription factor domain-containing protein n=1 Tax=Calycina marina TaxID=1763456 RepID=A0A9P7Z4L3_9HELO|nr:fungal-specific transcription factor domain-containing protein [Calycina marina]